MVRRGITYLRNLIVWMCPFLLFLLLVAGTIFLLKADFGKYIELTRVLIWPVTILLALFFFRKVFTYLFFSMDEFNFFGAKGELDDITEVISTQVEKRLREQDEKKKRSADIEGIASRLKKAEFSKSEVEKRATENLALAKDFFRKYQELSDTYSESTKELETLRQREMDRRARLIALRERMKQHESESRKLNEKIVSPSATDSTNETVLPKGEPKAQ